MTALILAVSETAAHLPARGSLLGLDVGTKTIGVATSDGDRRLATGVETIFRKTFTADAKRLLQLAAERRCVGFVLGLPLNMDGSEGPRAQSVRAFARNLSKLTAVHSRSRTRTDRSRRQPQKTRRGNRSARGNLHPTGRAGSTCT